MKNIDKVVSEAEKNGIRFSNIVDSPRSDLESVAKFRKICSANKCGNYNKSWTCPPAVGPAEDCVSELEEYENAVILIFEYDVDAKDKEKTDNITKDTQDRCRLVKKMFRKEGFKELTLSDGRCTFCKKCTYPDEPCRHPEEKIPSVSGYGIDMMDYLSKNGMDFGFSDNKVTLYGLILFK